MHYNESDELAIENAMPSDTFDKTKYFEFTIDGKNTYTDKDIWYEIVLTKGNNQTGKKRIKDNFKDCKIVSKKGILNYLESIVCKTTFISIVIASFALYNASIRIWKVEINGDYKEIEGVLNEELVKNNIVFSKYYPSSDKLKEIEGNISLYLSKEIEFLEYIRVECYLMIY